MNLNCYLDWIPISSNVYSGIISAFVFLFFVFLFFRPWFYISKKISVENGVFKFKVINFTLVKCTDVNIYLRKVQEEEAFPNGKDVEYKLLHVHTSSFIYISGLITGIFNSHRPNCIQIKADKDDLRNIVTNKGVYLELIITARHGISGLQKAKKRTYKHKQYVKPGKFESGFSTKIVPESADSRN